MTNGTFFKSKTLPELLGENSNGLKGKGLKSLLNKSDVLGDKLFK